MATCNCVVTLQKPTAVTHSVAGNFTTADHLNLIIAKCTRLEIHLLTPEGDLRLVSDVPIYGRIATLLLFRPHGNSTDSLFLVTEKFEYCVLRWDAEVSDLVTVATGDVSSSCGRPAHAGQIGTVDPSSSFIGLQVYDGLFKIMPIDCMEAAFDVEFSEFQALDIKFLHGGKRPTIAVLYMDNLDNRHLNTYELNVEQKELFAGSWSLSNVAAGASFFIPVVLPLGGVVVVGEEAIAYYNGDFVQSVPVTSFFTRATERVGSHGFEFLLSGDFSGQLHSLVIIHEKQQVTQLQLIPYQGDQTSIASTISYLDHGLVFLGSSFGDSQLLKLNIEPTSNGASKKVEVVLSYDNLGPILDFSVVDLHEHGEGKVVTCSGARKDGSLRVMRKGVGMDEKAAVELQGVKAIWSLKFSTTDAFHTFLVVSFVNETRFLAMNPEDELEETEIDGFDSHTETLFCKEVIYDQLLQVTPDAVKLVGSTTRRPRDEWKAPHGWSINIATGTSSQVLLTTGGGRLVYLEIKDGALIQMQKAQLEHEISCLDTSPIGEDQHYSKLAAVGMWKDVSVRIVALPSLEQLTKETLGSEVIARSVLLCRFEEVPYLLCALGDGHLFNFHLNLDTGELYGRKKLLLGAQPITLRLFSSNNKTQVFAATDNSTVITCRHNTFRYTSVFMNEVTTMCPFNTAAFPNCVAIAGDGQLAIGNLNDAQETDIRSIPLEEEQASKICHQEQSHTFAICTSKIVEDDGQLDQSHFVRLLDDQTFHIMSSYGLDSNEGGCSILSCSFEDDHNMYYCVGTSYQDGYIDPAAGRILTFVVEDMRLRLITEKETDGTVHSLTSFHGKLLASVDRKIQLYKWVVGKDGGRELQTECQHHGHNVPLEVHTRGDVILVGDVMNSMLLLVYNHKKKELEELAYGSYSNWLSSAEFFDDDKCIEADTHCNLLTVKKRDSEQKGKLEVVGKYHLGEFVNRFRHGTLVRLEDSDSSRMPILLFGTVSGAIGAVLSLPQDEFKIFEELEIYLSKEIKSVGGLRHARWRSFTNGNKMASATNFVDGDLIELFLDLNSDQMERISKAVGRPVEDLCKKVEELKRLH